MNLLPAELYFTGCIWSWFLPSKSEERLIVEFKNKIGEVIPPIRLQAARSDFAFFLALTPNI